ncbi:hypothetical protein GGR32_001307 [Mesonia hippocampi]|uniref:Na(+)-translocating NADH-quinone reductase subunit F n=1 Tax=Mesonia hippocampi TaxID=1628250 RepID=A0A840EU76_9FLAO|nr:Na(+)-translocating NADH-quinone reductase subunit F [Mesonia hippocampi]MBB4119016.1 hypothetical protein [Mesonia hippocampi]
MEILSEQELHNWAMNIVGHDLEEQGYEFLAVNSKLKKNPQFVALKKGQLSFVIVRAVSFPNDPTQYDRRLIQKIKTHAEKYKAKTLYAGVGLLNADDPTKPVAKNQDYKINYYGFQEIG